MRQENGSNLMRGGKGSTEGLFSPGPQAVAGLPYAQPQITAQGPLVDERSSIQGIQCCKETGGSIKPRLS